MEISITNCKDIYAQKLSINCRGDFLAFCVVFKRLLKDPGCHSESSSLPHISPIKSHFSGISHAQTPAMATSPEYSGDGHIARV